MLSPEENEILEQYYRQEYEDLFKFACYSLSNKNLAEVAVQDTFVIASKKFSDFIRSPNPVGWLFNTLKNNVRQLKRERQKALDRYVTLEAIQELSAEMPPIATMDVSKSADLQLLSRFYVQGYSLEEIAATLGITVPALKMRINRAKKRLRENPEIKKLKNFED